MPTLSLPAPALTVSTVRHIAVALAGKSADEVLAWIEDLTERATGSARSAARARAAGDAALAAELDANTQRGVNQIAAAIMLRRPDGTTPRGYHVQTLKAMDWDREGLEPDGLVVALGDAYLAHDVEVNDDGRTIVSVAFDAGVLRNTDAQGIAYRRRWVSHIEA